MRMKMEGFLLIRGIIGRGRTEVMDVLAEDGDGFGDGRGGFRLLGQISISIWGC